jgi:penicillin-binding protein 1A
MQRALEQSKNVPTALILAALPATPDGYTGLDSIMDLTQEYGLYDWTRPEDRQRERHYPFILGSADTSLLNVVTAYARIGNGGLRVRPLPGLRIEYLDRSPVVGASIDRSDLGEVQMVPAVARHQIRQMLQGVVRQGTAASLSRFAPALAGKTGTTDESRDVWFVGTSPQITMGVWIGYDNKKFLSSGATGGGIAVPIFDRIFDTFVDLQGPPVPFATTVPGIEMRWVDNASGALTFENKSASLMALKAPGRAPKIGGCR